MSAVDLSNDAKFMDKFSRQIGAYGLEAMSKLLNMKVLIVGVQGVGVETAKNLALAGPGAITLHDDAPATIADLGANFFLEEKDVGTPRAQAVASKLQELNKMVAVKVHKGPLTEAAIREHTAVVWCDGTREDLLHWDAFCRAHHILFIAAGTFGPTCYIFSDFGPSFTVRDANGEAVATRIVTHVSSEENAVVTLLGAAGEEGARHHNIEESEHEGWVELSDIEGLELPSGAVGLSGPYKIQSCTKSVQAMVEKDGKKTQVTKTVFDPYRLKLVGADTRGLSPYVNGGVMTQVKVPVNLTYRPLQENLSHPVAPGQYGLLFTDGGKFGRGEQLHLGLLAIWEFQQRSKRLPEDNEQDVEAVLAIAREINAAHGKQEGALSLEELDESVVKQMAQFAAVELQPLSAFLGGLIAQEVVKGTGKYSPLNQWLHLDFFEMLPDNRPPAHDIAPKGCRYDNLIRVYGETFVREKLMEGRTFMVGCGALGCEYLKNFAQLGFACGTNGLITVTDNDRIEVSNLSRQFLFREHNVGQPKSRAASAMVKSMNKNIKVKANEDLVSANSEHLYPDDFWEAQNFVTNALDNVKARLYVDSRCVYYGKPLLESGTLGTKCNVQVVIPHLTASYADGPKDQEDEDAIPMCTLRNFPSLIEHCIEWSRAQFEDAFAAPFAEAKKFCNDKTAYIAAVRASTLGLSDQRAARSAIPKALDGLRSVRRLLDSSKSMTFEACVAEACALFHRLHRDRVLQLIHSFPEDHTTDAGEKFWTGAKRFPQAATLDVDNEPDHLLFITAASNIFAACFGVVPPPEVEVIPPTHEQRNKEFLSKIVRSIDVPMWEPSGEKVDLSEGKEAPEEGKTENDVDDAMDDGDSSAELANLLEELEQVDVTKVGLEPASFEKDVDANFHIDFVASASNLRAWNYRIRGTSRYQVKMIAGKIIPAIATTTASVCGLVMIELLKVLQNKPLAAYKDSSNNLGLNSYFFSEPVPPVAAKDEYDPINMAEVKCRPPGFTKWHKTIIDCGDLTLRQFLEAYNKQTGLKCTLLLHGASELEGPQRGLMLYDAEAWNPRLKAVYESAMDKPLRAWAIERYAPVEVVTPLRQCIELQCTCVDDEDQPYKVPAIVYRWAH